MTPPRPSPLVSIGVPVYNGEPYLAEALDSLLAQTFEDLEVIICDNASTDGTEEIGRAYAARDGRVRYVRNPSNVGPTANHRRTFELSRGRYFRWAAADDVSAPQSLARCVEVLDREPGVVLAYPKTRFIDEHGRVTQDYEDRLDLRSRSAGERYWQVRTRLARCNAMFGLMRADVLKQTALLGDYRSADLVFLAELSLYGMFWEVPEFLFYRRFHSAASSAMTDAELGAFYHPATPRRIEMWAWRHQWEYWRAVERAPLGGVEKWRVRLMVARGWIGARNRLARQLVNAAWQGIVNASRGGVGSSPPARLADRGTRVRPATPPGKCDFAIVGGGIVGLAAAYKLLLARPDAAVVVLEKEDAVGSHQSGHNSGVLHAGLEYAPGSLKAALAVSGIRQMTDFCAAHSIPHDICGKLVVAVSDAEVPRLRQLMQRGIQNGLRGLEWLEPDRMREIEPHVGGVAGVSVPQEGVADFGKVCETLATLIESWGGRVVTRARVRALRPDPSGWVVETGAGDFAARFLVNCAGLHADRVATMAGERPSLAIVPFRGQYYTLRAERESLVRHLIYPVADPAFPFLGVHLTRSIHGGVHAGPTALVALAREGYGRGSLNMRDLREALAFPGLWRFLARHPSLCAREFGRSFSRRPVARALRRLVPALRAEDLLPGDVGVRAQAMLPNGELVSDFVFVNSHSALHVLNAPSPGATAALAIGDEIVRQALATVDSAPSPRPVFTAAAEKADAGAPSW